MARSKHRRPGKPRYPARITAGGRTAELSAGFREERVPPGSVAPTEAELRQAMESIPEEIGWDWAVTRLTPIFDRHDGGGITGDPTLHAVTPLGVAVGFGIEIGPMFARVTTSMARRWEASLEQIEAAAFRHLERAVADIRPSSLQQAVHRGHLVRALAEPGGWASSVILAGEEAVRRIFGAHDQVFMAPGRNVLLSFDAKTPPSVILDLSMLLEESDPHPLMLDPFRLIDGRLSWDGWLPAGIEPELDDPFR